MNWYQKNKRTLPFRDIKNPYFTWVSEIMLQQTQVDTVIPYFERFIQRFPTPCDLAHASLDDVLKQWEGLGYYRRAKHLHESAQWICFERNGQFPDDLESIESLKGVGRYISRAIYSIAFNQKAAAVDGNVIRFMSRYHGDSRDFTKTKNFKALESKVFDLIGTANPSDFTQAMMEMGALVCQKKPKCQQCPFQNECVAFQSNATQAYPYLPKKQMKKVLTFHVFVPQKGKQTILVKRNADGLLANLYTFPQFEGTLDDAKSQFENVFNTALKTLDYQFEITHQFSHQTWILNVYTVKLTNAKHLPWVSLNDFPYAIAKAHLNIMAKL